MGGVLKKEHTFKFQPIKAVLFRRFMPLTFSLYMLITLIVF